MATSSHAVSHLFPHPVLSRRPALSAFKTAFDQFADAFRGDSEDQRLKTKVDALRYGISSSGYAWATLTLEQRELLLKEVIPATWSKSRQTIVERRKAVNLEAWAAALGDGVSIPSTRSGETPVAEALNSLVAVQPQVSGRARIFTADLLADLTSNERTILRQLSPAQRLHWTEEQQLLIAVHQAGDQEQWITQHKLLGSPLLDHNRATVMCFNRMRQQLLDAGHNNSNGSRFLALIEKTYGHPGWYWEILTLKQRENLVQVADWCWRNPYSGPLPTEGQLLAMIGPPYLDNLEPHVPTFADIRQTIERTAVRCLDKTLASAWNAAMLREFNKVTVADLTEGERAVLKHYLQECREGRDVLYMNPQDVLRFALTAPHPHQTMHSLSRSHSGNHRILTDRQAQRYGRSAWALE